MWRNKTEAYNKSIANLILFFYYYKTQNLFIICVCLSVCPSPTSADSKLRKLGCEKLSSLPRTLNVIVELCWRKWKSSDWWLFIFLHQKQINFFFRITYLQSYIKKFFRINVSLFLNNCYDSIVCVSIDVVAQQR